MKWFASHIKAAYWELESDGKCARTEKIIGFAKKAGANGFNLGDLSKRSIGTSGETSSLVEKLVSVGEIVMIEPEFDPKKPAAKPRFYLSGREPQKTNSENAAN